MFSFILGIVGITLAASALAIYAVGIVSEDVRMDKRRENRVYPWKRLPTDQKMRYYVLAIGGAFLCSLVAGLGNLGFPRFIGIILSIIPAIAALYFLVLLVLGAKESRTANQTLTFLAFGLIAAIVFIYSFSTIFQGLSWGWIGIFLGLLISGIAIIAIWSNACRSPARRPRLRRREYYDELDEEESEGNDNNEDNEEEGYCDDE